MFQIIGIFLDKVFGISDAWNIIGSSRYGSEFLLFAINDVEPGCPSLFMLSDPVRLIRYFSGFRWKSRFHAESLPIGHAFIMQASYAKRSSEV